MTERSRSETNAASPSETNAASDDGITLAVDAAFDLLSNARRRGVLYALKRDAVGRDGAATVDELTEWVAAWQGDGDSSPSPEQVRTSLVHAHLPRLDDADVVDYDRETGRVELSEADDLDPLLRATSESKPSRTSTDHHSSLAD